MRAVPWPDPDPVVAAAIRAKYDGRRVPLAVAVRDRLGQWLADEVFAAAFGVRGGPGWPPSRLAVVTVLQMAEDMTDRQAADAVRTRLDWQYALGLGLADAGFDHSVLSEFRDRVAGHGLEEAALDALLAKVAAGGLVKAGGKQRTDSTHVIAAIRALHTTELAGESVRAALEALAVACPDWLGQRLCVSDWNRRYGTPVSTWRRPPGQAGRDKLALQYARDGYALVAACYEESAPPWLREIPAVQVLRTVLIQRFTRAADDSGREVIGGRDPGSDGVPPAHIKISSPYDTDARWGAKKDLTWLGYKLHVPETCDDPPACGCPADPAAAAPRRCGHDVRPNLITGVATTPASVADVEMTTAVNAALHRKDLAPGRHYLDSGYASARNVLDAARQFGITLVTPLLADSSRQARAGDGYDRTAFAIDYDARTATCPQGRPSTGWTPSQQGGRDIIVVRFGITTCRPCPARQLCTKAVRNGRQLTILPRDQHELQAAARARQQSADWQEEYKRRAGVEATISQAVTVTGCRRARYRGLRKPISKTSTQPWRSTFTVWTPTGTTPPLNRARTSHLARLDLSLELAA